MTSHFCFVNLNLQFVVTLQYFDLPKNFAISPRSSVHFMQQMKAAEDCKGNCNIQQQCKFDASMALAGLTLRPSSCLLREMSDEGDSGSSRPPNRIMRAGTAAMAKDILQPYSYISEVP